MAKTISRSPKIVSKPWVSARVLLALGLLLVVLLGLLAAWRLSNNGKINLTDLPKVRVLSWVNQTKPVTVPTKVGVYDFAAVDSSSEAKRLGAQLLGVNKLTTKGDALVSYNAGNDNSDLSAFVFNTNTKTFSYAGTKGYKLATQGDVSVKAAQFLQTIIADQTLKATATYKRTDKPGVTFVEFHRDWDKVGSPIVNPLGLLNMKQTESLSALSLGGQSSRQPDNTIYATSDQSDGLGRRSDFNTAVIGINEPESTVVSISSNVRELKSSAASQADAVTYDKAVSDLMSNKYAFFNTTPDGVGLPAFDKVYPNHAGTAKQATITDSRLVYLEELPGVNQARLEPYYIFRGNATLDSGYNVRFVAGVTATKKSLTASLIGFLSGSSAWAEGGAGATVTPTTVTPPPTDNPPPPADNPPPPAAKVCTPAVADLSNQQKVSSSLMIGQLTKSGLDKINKVDNHHGEIIEVGDWYTFSNSRDLTADDLVAAVQAVPENIQQRKARALDELSNDPSCPVRISGMSPSLFVYGPAGSTVAITPSSQATYSDPGLNNNTWNVALGSDGMAVNGLALPYVYYEYQPLSFARPTEGWKVSKSKLPDLAQKLSQQLKLNVVESDRLLFELSNAASTIGDDNLFVGPLDTEEVNSKLPLSVSGGSALVRVQFYVGKAGAVNYTQPVLAPVHRGESMVLELGASGQR